MSKTENLLKCGACGHSNGPDVKFCAGCGHSLYEPCSECNKPVLLGQKFCGDCGADLETVLNKKRQQRSELLAKAIEMGKESAFDDSIRLLHQVTEETDHRYADIVSQAKVALGKIELLRDKTVATAENRIKRAKSAADRDDKLETVRLLKKVPANLLDDESRGLLAKFESHQEQSTELITSLQSAMKEMNYSVAGGLIDQLLQLNPDDQKFTKLAKQISDRLIQSADRRFQKKDYAGALEKLNSVCSVCRDDSYDEMYENIQSVQWLAQQCQLEPFATPALVKLAIRLAKLIPDDSQATKQAKRFIAASKTRPANPRWVFNPTISLPPSILGGEVAGHLAIPCCVVSDDDVPLRKTPSQYNVAIGLAIQGLGMGRYDGAFLPKKSLLGGIGRRKKDTCWGIDVGTSGVRAVKLRRVQASKKEEPTLELLDTFWLEFELSISHVSMVDQADSLIQDALERFVEEKEPGDDPVWGNICGSQLISRFVVLPPVKDKQTVQLLEQEIAARVPFALDDLEVIRWIAELDKASAAGRPAMVVAARKQIVSARFELFKEAGIECAGIQSDPLALANLASVEFKETWQANPSSQDGSGEQEEDEETESDDDDDLDARTVAIVDSGATTTTLLLLSRQACWFWTTESGGDDLTTIAARTTGKVQVESEHLKREPAMIVHPANTFLPIEDKMSQTRLRFMKLMEEAEKQIGDFDVQSFWCTGGSPLTLGWVRHVMISQAKG